MMDGTSMATSASAENSSSSRQDSGVVNPAIQQHHSNNESIMHRPTEAQLRWAQFHHKRRAQIVKSMVRRLWDTPKLVSDVPGSLPEDGNTTTESEDSKNRVRLVEKPKVSRGRRAMLRVSKRTYERRKEQIQQNGYQNTSYSEDETYVEDDENALLLEAIFTAEANPRKRAHRRRRKYLQKRGRFGIGNGPQDEKDRLKRFEAACQAMIMNLAAPAPLAIPIPTKRWTRTQEADGYLQDEYEDLKWGIRKRGKLNVDDPTVSFNEGRIMNNMTPIDRGASWMMHLPMKPATASREAPYPFIHQDSNISNASTRLSVSSTLVMRAPGRQKFNLLVELVQKQMIERGMAGINQAPLPRPVNAPKMRLKYLTTTAAEDHKKGNDPAEGDYHHLEAHDKINNVNEEKKIPDGEEQVDMVLPPPPRRKTHAMAGRFLGDFTKRNSAPRFERIVGRLSIATNDSPTKGCCPRCSRPSPVESDFFSTLRGDVKPSPVHSIAEESDFFAQMRQAAPQEASKTDDGIGPSLVCDECCQQLEDESHHDGMNSPISCQQSPVMHTSPPSTHSTSSPSNERHGIEAERYREEYLQHQPLVDQPGVRVEENSESFPPQNTPRRGQRRDDDTHSEHSALSGLWNRGRNNLNNVISTAMNSIPEQAAKQMPRLSTLTSATTPARSSSPANLKARAASVSGRVSGFLNNLRGTDQESDSDNDYHGNLLALGAFRKTQDARRESSNADDTSSTSSFRVLPAGIRGVVQSMYGSSADRRKESWSSRSVASRSSISELSPEKYREVHDKLIKSSPLLGDGEQEQSIIDTDETQSGASNGRFDNNQFISSLMMSPALLTKRLHQAVRAIEKQNWDQVSYLINANPWLAEMTEHPTKQYLLHKLAYYGNGDTPATLNEALLKMFPSAVHKFDEDGNVPLHLAAAAGNFDMIFLLGEAFPSGASIRNEDGMLPLHFAIAAQGGYDSTPNDDELDGAIQIIKSVLKLFPRAVSIPDNGGNLPIHLAVSSLEGPVGVDVVYMLLDEADRQLQDPCGARFHNKVKMEELDGDTVSTVATEHETDNSTVVLGDDGVVHCNMVRNDKGETPLLTAIRTKNGWEIVEAVVCGPGGKRAALTQDNSGNNALHLLVSEEYYCDPAATLSILKVAPEAASKRNGRGMLPIEDACMQGLPQEIILSLVLVDLPIDLDDKEGVKVRKGFGGSWWFLTCDCDDQYVDVVREVVSICTFQQVRELCFLKASNGVETVLSRATPKCRLALTQALRFVGRFEFVGDSAVHTNTSIGLKEFDALDFGGEIGKAQLTEEGRRVLLKCYTMEESFLRETLNLCDLDIHHVEEVLTFAVNESSDGQPLEEQGSNPTARQFCISIERPSLTLDRVVDGMLRNEGYRRDPELRKRYAGKIFTVLRLIAKSLRHLHASGVVHGDLCMEQCGKFDDASWKVMGRLQFQPIGEKFDSNRWGLSYPPEAIIEKTEENNDICDSDDAPVHFNPNLVTDPTIDVWAFGKLAYEVLVGTPLLESDLSKMPSEDFVTMLGVMEWDQENNLKQVYHDLLDTGITESASDLITSCLFPLPEDRPATMEEILSNPAWKEMRRNKDPSRRHRGESSSTAQSSIS